MRRIGHSGPIHLRTRGTSRDLLGRLISRFPPSETRTQLTGIRAIRTGQHDVHLAVALHQVDFTTHGTGNLPSGLVHALVLGMLGSTPGLGV
jgi:hypothetical protein